MGYTVANGIASGFLGFGSNVPGRVSARKVFDEIA
jgi:hypothetical protein